MASLVPYLRSLKTKPRGFHVALVLVLAWVPTLTYLAGHPVIAAALLFALTAVFLTIHPLQLKLPNPPENADQQPPAANVE